MTQNVFEGRGHEKPRVSWRVENGAIIYYIYVAGIRPKFGEIRPSLRAVTAEGPVRQP
jgi:hypothetical protein